MKNAPDAFPAEHRYKHNSKAPIGTQKVKQLNHGHQQGRMPPLPWNLKTIGVFTTGLKED